MAMTFEAFLKAANAEFVAGNIIVGVMADRKIVGTYDGVFQLNADGQAILEALENPVVPEDAAETKVSRRKKSETTDVAAE